MVSLASADGTLPGPIPILASIVTSLGSGGFSGLPIIALPISSYILTISPPRLIVLILVITCLYIIFLIKSGYLYGVYIYL